MRFLFTLFALLMLATAAHAADSRETVEWQGERRDVYIHVPDNVAIVEKLPVVLVLHGGGGNASGMRQMTGMDDVADKNGFIAAYPEGNSAPIMDKLRTWNAGKCCGYAASHNVDDVGFIGAVIDMLAKKYKADTDRIYATGHSNGGQMSYRLACEMSGRIAAIAPNAGQRVLDDCHPKRAVPVMDIHGTADPCARFDGGEKCGGCFSSAFGGLFKGKNDQWPCKSVRHVLREHAAINGCEPVTDVTLQKGAVTCEKFQCPQNAGVALCAIEGAGHVWAGQHDRGPAVCAQEPEKKICTRYSEIVGPAYRDMDAGEIAWDFLRHYSLKGEIQ